MPLNAMPKAVLDRHGILFTASELNSDREIVVYRGEVLPRDCPSDPQYLTYRRLLGPALESPEFKQRHALFRWLCRCLAPVKVGLPAVEKVGLSVRQLRSGPIYYTHSRAGVNVHFREVYVPLETVVRWDIFADEVIEFITDAFRRINRR